MKIIFILSILFVSYFFYTLGKKNNKNIILILLLGIFFFIVINVVLEFFVLFFFDFLRFNYTNQILIDCFCIPFSLLITGILYKFLEKKFKKEKNIFPRT